MRKEFLDRVIECQEKIEYFEKTHKWLGNIKILVIIVFFICLIKLVTGEFNFMLAIGTLALFELYLFLSVLHWKTDSLKEENLVKKTIHQNYVDRIDGTWSAFSDNGDEFIDKGHSYTSDLDVFGENSLFQYLNTTVTPHGRSCFARDLKGADFNNDEIRKRQEATWELSANKNFAVDFQYEGAKIMPGGDIEKLIGLLSGSDNKASMKAVGSYLKYIPIFTSIFVLAVYFMKAYVLYIPAILVLISHIALWIYSAFKNKDILGEITGAGYKMDKYSKLFAMVERRTFDCEKLREIKNTIASKDIKVSEAVRELNFIIMKIDLRRSFIMYFLLNIFFLWDINCAFSLKCWREKYSGHIENWFEALGELESLMCFANLSFVEENAAIAEITDEMLIEGENLGHPLINSNRRINNNVKLNNEIYIVSGSNMSGKTTFLRTIGINMVLGLAGGFCCAGNITIPNIKIATSMRIADDLSEGVSTFYAELEKVKGVIDVCENGDAIFLIDEIFRGTNSQDRLDGARTVIKSLEKKGAIGIITTHDLALCDEADNKRIVNYSFSERYENNEIFFDYKLRQGKSVSTNARFLMSKLGINNK